MGQRYAGGMSWYERGWADLLGRMEEGAVAAAHCEVR